MRLVVHLRRGPLSWELNCDATRGSCQAPVYVPDVGPEALRFKVSFLFEPGGQVHNQDRMRASITALFGIARYLNSSHTSDLFNFCFVDSPCKGWVFYIFFYSGGFGYARRAIQATDQGASSSRVCPIWSVWDRDKFISRENARWYEVKETNAIVVEKIVSDEVNNAFSIHCAFDVLDWALMLGFEGNYYPCLVREFYTNIENKEDVVVTRVVTSVKGCRIELDCATFWENNRIGDMIRSTVRSKRGVKSLCYPLFLSKVFEFFGVDVTEEHIVVLGPTNVLTEANIYMIGYVRVRGAWYNLVLHHLHAGEVADGRNAPTVTADDEKEH
ncbi:hypothetical protein FNV43_RR10968 [Rhamnella rubrinervis]|uniref:Uncharacterized protein n=1 Tax=Rhamnella rubrinervis TaxID=2594499 RepID=A0A8K0MH74_9ROSA|nr:hypothetical protein FNV43_RR10968 [Rhamnella rubrinervis]